MDTIGNGGMLILSFVSRVLHPSLQTGVKRAAMVLLSLLNCGGRVLHRHPRGVAGPGRDHSDMPRPSNRDSTIGYLDLLCAPGRLSARYR